jgi:hypothetical protein
VAASSPDPSFPRIPELEQDVRELAATAGLVVLALAGVFAITVGVLGVAAHCYDVCDPRADSWFSRPGAWERWVQLGLAVLFGALVFAAAVSGFRSRYSTAALLVIAAGPALTAWLLVVT